MVNRDELVSLLKDEIAQAKSASYRFLILHLTLVNATILVGGLTTYVTGPGPGTPIWPWLPPLLAALTTILGTVANQTGFRKKYNGYRLTKTEFQNLEMDLMKVEGDQVDDSFVERVKVIRCQKVARTTDSG